ncbi:MAG TPA: C39 family peptidase [Chloroflexota bacterium]|nr:C39 family peptidase [Chloroflexota bacterium]
MTRVPLILPATPSISWRVIHSARKPSSHFSLQQVMDTLSPLAQPNRWIEAADPLRSSREPKGARRVQAIAGVAEGLMPSQFDASISSTEANAACGPAAAVAFARASGKNVSLRQAVDLARTVGWTVSGGMNGVVNQKRLLDKMGIPALLDTSGDWSKVARTVSAGSPVTISTPGHYFVADDYDPKTGRFHVGASGTAYQGGKEWMTRQEMEGAAGRINGTLVMKDRSRWMA